MERTPLQSKPVNIFGGRRSPLKRLSPTKLTTSPIKKQRHMSPKRANSRTFEIFQDSQNYREGLDMKSHIDLTPKIQRFGLDDDEDKENIDTTSTNVKGRSVGPLRDLSIAIYPGYLMQSDVGPLGTKTALTEPWYSNRFSNKTVLRGLGRINVPSFITPPKRDRVKAYKFVKSANNDELELPSTVSQTSVDDLEIDIDATKRKLNFIYNDTLKF